MKKINVKQNFINDNKKIQKELVKKVYSNIFRLDTKLLQEHEFKVFEELIKRKDYCELELLIFKYKAIKLELLSRGVELND